jgi:hypothetical protein
MESVANFLGSLGSSVFRIAVLLFVIINGAAIIAFALTRSRHLVNEWTRRIVTIDAILLGAGLGVPLLAGAAKLTVKLLSGMTGGVAALLK